MNHALKANTYQAGDIVLVRGFKFQDGTGQKNRPALIISRSGKELRARGIYSSRRTGRVSIPADYQTGLAHDSFLDSRITELYVGQVIKRYGEAPYDYDPFEDFVDL